MTYVRGATWLFQNKTENGSYINVKSKVRADMMPADRGYGAIALELDWGNDEGLFRVENGEFLTDSLSYFGMNYTDDEAWKLRELYKKLKFGSFYRLNGGGAKAKSDIGDAKYSGVKGNTLICIVSNESDNKFLVRTFFVGMEVDTQLVSSVEKLEDTEFVTFDKKKELAAGTFSFEGGTNGTATVAHHQKFLNLMENEFTNVIICDSTEEVVKDLYATYCKRMREDEGVRMQVVLYNRPNSDYEGIINVTTKAKHDQENALVYWIGGAEASCAVNASLTNTAYDGELEMHFLEKRSDIRKAIEKGEFVFHQSYDKIVVYSDINSFVSFEKTKNSDFSFNQIIRVVDEIANSTAKVFNKTYLGKVANNANGRTILWNDIVNFMNELQAVEAIQEFNPKEVVVEQGKQKDGVYIFLPCQPVIAMQKLYMLVEVA